MKSSRITASSISCCALLGVFVIENHCGLDAVDHAQLAFHFLEQKLYSRALLEAQRAARQDRDDSTPHVIAALAQLGLGHLNDTVASLRTAILTNPEAPSLYATLRDICIQEGCIDLARDTFRSLLDDLPGNWQVRASLGWAHLRLDENEEALPLLEAAVAEADASVQREPRLFARTQLGRTYMDLERFDDAAKILEQALEFDKDSLLLGLALGECYLLQGHASAADEILSAALSRADNAVAAAVRIARTYYDAGSRKQAIVYYERALEGEGSALPLVLNNLAWAYAEEGIELDRAENLSREAVKSDADNVVYLDTYAEVLYLQGRHRRAMAIMALAIELEPEEGDQYDYLLQQMQKFRGVANL